MSTASSAPTLRDQQRLRTRRLLIDAAVDLFGERGYGQTAIEDISGAIGASRATFYLHFRNKREVLLAKYEESYPSFVARYQDLDTTLCRDSNSPPDELRSWLVGWYEWFQENRALVSALQEASVVEPDLIAELGDPTQIIDVMKTYLKSLSEEDRSLARLRVRLLEIMTTAVMNWIVFRGPPIDVEAIDVEASLDFLGQLWSDVLTDHNKPQERVGAHSRSD